MLGDAVFVIVAAHALGKFDFVAAKPFDDVGHVFHTTTIACRFLEDLVEENPEPTVTFLFGETFSCFSIVSGSWVVKAQG